MQLTCTLSKENKYIIIIIIIIIKVTDSKVDLVLQLFQLDSWIP